MRPILFHVGSYSVHSYGVLLMLAIVCGVWAATSIARRRKLVDPKFPISPEDVMDVTLWIVAGIVIGARLLFVIVDWSSYKGHPLDAFKVWEGGLSFHGGLFGVLIALGLFSARRRIPFLLLGDVIAPAAMIGYAVGRVGCLLNGCCYGAPTNMPWGIRFDDDNHWTPPSHPTQLYSTLMSLVFFALLLWLGRRPSAFVGQVSFCYILFSAVERFTMEIWRAGTTSTVVALGLTDVQWLCIGMALVASGALVWLKRRSENAQTPKLRVAAS